MKICQLLRVRTLVYCYAYDHLVLDLVRRLMFRIKWYVGHWIWLRPQAKIWRNPRFSVSNIKMNSWSLSASSKSPALEHIYFGFFHFILNSNSLCTTVLVSQQFSYSPCHNRRIYHIPGKSIFISCWQKTLPCVIILCDSLISILQYNF
jgi:hypothetical protein